MLSYGCEGEEIGVIFTKANGPLGVSVGMSTAS
jgi:hypothetical protein